MSQILIKMLIVQVHLKVESRKLEEVLDPDLKSRTDNHETLLQVAKIGVHCTHHNIKQRPFISQVSQELELVLHMIDELPTNPPSTSCSPRQESSSGGGTGKSSGSDFSLPELGGKDSHIKFDGMAWIDIKALDGGSLQDFCDNNLQDYEWPTSLLHDNNKDQDPTRPLTWFSNHHRNRKRWTGKWWTKRVYWGSQLLTWNSYEGYDRRFFLRGKTFLHNT